MKFYVQANSDYWVANSMKDEIIEAFQAAGHAYTSELGKAGFVLNYTDLEKPAIFHRRSHAVSIISIVTVPQGKSDLRSVCYTGLVRTLSNLLICVVNGPTGLFHDTGVRLLQHPVPPGRYRRKDNADRLRAFRYRKQIFYRPPKSLLGLIPRR